LYESLILIKIIDINILDFSYCNNCSATQELVFPKTSKRCHKPQGDSNGNSVWWCLFYQPYANLQRTTLWYV